MHNVANDKKDAEINLHISSRVITLSTHEADSKLYHKTTTIGIKRQLSTDCWVRNDHPERHDVRDAAVDYNGDEELMPLAEHEAPAASSDDLSVAESCPDTSSKYHSCEAVEIDDE